MTAELSPFSCSHSPELPELLNSLNCSIAISTYQAGKVILISATPDNRLIQLPRSFNKPMGIAADRNKMAIATQTEVVVFNNAERMSGNYPQQPQTYDALYLPRASYYTGEIDIHDLHWVDQTIWAVNTRFSCLATIDHQHSFTPRWKPFFISNITPDDQCHLNGVAFEHHIPKYVTALGKSELPEGWRQHKAHGGILMDVVSNKILSDELQMPHSPRLYHDDLYVLESAAGNLLKIDRSSGKKTIVITMNGFVRGMDKLGDYLCIGLSKLRNKSAAFSDLPIADKSIFCGVVILHLPTARIISHLRYENSVEEIFDVRILPGMRRPGLLSHQKLEARLALTTPDADFWAVLKEEGKP